MIQMHQDNILKYSNYFYYLLIKTLEVQLYGVEQRREDTVMNTNLLMMQMDVLLTISFQQLFIICSNIIHVQVGNILMNGF